MAGPSTKQNAPPAATDGAENELLPKGYAMNEEYTDSDRLRELAMVRSTWVDTFVQRRVDRRDGDCTGHQIDEWENEGYRKWRGYYPALNSLFPSHLPTEVSA